MKTPTMEGSISPLPESSTSTLSRNQKKKRRKKLGRMQAIDCNQASVEETAGVPEDEIPNSKRMRGDESCAGAGLSKTSSPVSTQASAANCMDQPRPRLSGVVHEELPNSGPEIVSRWSQVSCESLHARLLREHECLLAQKLASTGVDSAPRPQIECLATPSSASAAHGDRFAPHGNYHRYYGYRLGQAFEADPRLGLLERSWFRGKRCMDVGCNEGVVTLAIAQKFGCQSMVGVDIDASLIKRACTSLRTLRTAAVKRATAARAGNVDPSERRQARDALRALTQTWFVHADFLESSSSPRSLDAITCLSVSKWIHLWRGDAGVVALFHKFRELLAPGGILVLEPQPWSSYKTAVNKLKKQKSQGNGNAQSKDLNVAEFHRLSTLKLPPDEFATFLCDTLGFRLMRRLEPQEASSGFTRPVLVFRRL